MGQGFFAAMPAWMSCQQCDDIVLQPLFGANTSEWASLKSADWIRRDKYATADWPTSTYSYNQSEHTCHLKNEQAPPKHPSGALP